MEDSRYLRKVKIPILLDEDDTPLLNLLRDLFIENDAPYNIKELAADLGVSVFAVYKMFGADRPLRAETLIRIIQFIAERDSKDYRLADFIVGHAGYVAMPHVKGEDIVGIREILVRAADVMQGRGK